jgi:hypothetical protein
MEDKIYAPGVIKTQRRRIGWHLVGTANVLESMHQGNLDMQEESRTDFLEDNEAEQLAKIARTLKSCEHNLRVLARRLGVDQ